MVEFVQLQRGHGEPEIFASSSCRVVWVESMASLFNAVAGLSLASVALSSPVAPHIHTRHYNATSPCAQVGTAIVGKNVTAGTATVPAELAWDCINSVPFNQSAALALVDGVVPYFKWQSNTVWLKDPPAEYAEKVQPAVDIWGGLEEIREKVNGGEYKNEYEVRCLSPHYEEYELIQNSSVSSSTPSCKAPMMVTLCTSPM